ncbi:hypothetical protein BP6252_12524 [Coleophoma cylindrospora]|uniref:Peptidase A1 domain-containing protein n=1 Tax=Coleophoma cylindrospora TaxID=1849047 RepID=A0A3D8QCJ7_9HELO|nr:hypothetical protein BP6252_12524 [Coleophoma cylindrospora]
MALRPRATTVPAAISFAPSQEFQGNDGPWSTFVITVGTPAQVFHVLITTAGQETWVPVPEGCLSTDPSDCGALRGALPFDNVPSNGFDVNASSTWEAINLYELGLDSDLNYTGNGEYGFDTVGMQVPNSGGLNLTHQVVAGIATKDFYLGIFPLGPKPTNFTNFDNPQPSYLWTLKNQSYIPSLSWGYTAGAKYRLKQVPGSLTLGGYDSSRFTPNNMTFSFSSDDSKPLTLGLQAITATNTFQGVASLLKSGILTFIDSTVPEIWLPTSACAIFESVFGLEYDANTDRYLVNDTVHANLTSLNPVVTFKLGNSADDTGAGQSIEISLPYGAFDLQADYPIYNSTTNYFPLRRAYNESQYTLGRTFLQEAYVIADYERQNFSVSQCVFLDNNPEKIVSIHSPSTETAKKSGLSTGAKAGIAVGIVVFAIILAGGAFLFFRHRRRNQLKAMAAALAALPIIDKPEMGTEGALTEERFQESQMVEAPAAVPGEMPDTPMSAERMRHELSAEESTYFELPGSRNWERSPELEGDTNK